MGCGGGEIDGIDVQLTNPQQLRDAVMSTWTKISEEGFKHQKKAPIFYQQVSPNTSESQETMIIIPIVSYYMWFM